MRKKRFVFYFCIFLLLIISIRANDEITKDFLALDKQDLIDMLNSGSQINVEAIQEIIKPNSVFTVADVLEGYKDLPNILNELLNDERIMNIVLIESNGGNPNAVSALNAYLKDSSGNPNVAVVSGAKIVSIGDDGKIIIKSGDKQTELNINEFKDKAVSFNADGSVVVDNQVISGADKISVVDGKVVVDKADKTETESVVAENVVDQQTSEDETTIGSAVSANVQTVSSQQSFENVVC